MIVVKDFETGTAEYEMYTYGEEIVVMPVTKAAKKPVWRLASREIEKELAHRKPQKPAAGVARRYPASRMGVMDVIRSADWLIDLGPEGGDDGGRIVAQGTPEDVAAVAGSFTGAYLAPLLGVQRAKAS